LNQPEKISSGSTAKPRSSRDFLLYLCRFHPRRTVTAIVLLFLATSAEALSITALLPVIGNMTGEAAPDNMITSMVNLVLTFLGLESTLYSLLGLIVGCMFLKSLLLWGAFAQVGVAAAAISTELRLELIHSLFRAKWRFFTHNQSGSVLNSLSAEASMAGSAFTHAARYLSNIIQIIFYAVVMAIVSWPVVLFGIITGLVIQL
jgi:ABC-type multidrug transport system fused ATPase/permease subunit